MVRVSMGGRPVAGFPRNLQVVAAQTDPTQCVIRGDALAAGGGVVVGDVTKASLVARDRFGNACLEGGDQVMVRLLGPAGATDADVADYGDGTYGLAFTVPRAGEWRAHVAVNGEENPAPLARFAATQGRLDAGQLTLKISGTQGGAVADAFAVGSGLGMGRDALPTQTFGVDGGARASVRPAVGVETTVYIQALDYELSGREVGGGEPVCLRLISPSGVSANVPLRASKDRARFPSHRALAGGGRTRARRLAERRRHRRVTHARRRRRRGRTPARLPRRRRRRGKCVAGERARFSVEARDARGNRLVAGGASLTLQVQVPGSEPTRGAVLDQGDGTYACSYAVDVAGPYLLVLASQSSRLALEGACRAGPADPAKCRVDAAELKRLTAGARGVARITRYDRFGNVVPAGPELLPFRVGRGRGPGGDGDGGSRRRRVRSALRARVAGRYSLKVFSGHGASVPVSGSPFDAVVLPGQAASSSCVARLEGTRCTARA